MSESVLVAIIIAIPGLIGAIVSLITLAVTSLANRRTDKKLDDTHDLVNGQMAELKGALKEAAFGQGQIEGRKIEEKAAGIAAATVAAAVDAAVTAVQPGAEKVDAVVIKDAANAKPAKDA